MTGTAVIYLPELNDSWFNQCIDHCQRRGYQWSVVIGDVDKVGNVLLAGEVKIIVVARQEHFVPDWMPRVETVGSETRRITREVVDAARIEPPTTEQQPTVEPPTAEPPRAAKRNAAGKHRRRPNLLRQD